MIMIFEIFLCFVIQNVDCRKKQKRNKREGEALHNQ